jgi:hypothetical protein
MDTIDFFKAWREYQGLREKREEGEKNFTVTEPS